MIFGLGGTLLAQLLAPHSDAAGAFASSYLQGKSQGAERDYQAQQQADLRDFQAQNAMAAQRIANLKYASQLDQQLHAAFGKKEAAPSDLIQATDSFNQTMDAMGLPEMKHPPEDVAAMMQAHQITSDYNTALSLALSHLKVANDKNALPGDRIKSRNLVLDLGSTHDGLLNKLGITAADLFSANSQDALNLGAPAWALGTKPDEDSGDGTPYLAGMRNELLPPHVYNDSLSASQNLYNVLRSAQRNTGAEDMISDATTDDDGQTDAWKQNLNLLWKQRRPDLVRLRNAYYTQIRALREQLSSLELPAYGDLYAHFQKETLSRALDQQIRQLGASAAGVDSQINQLDAKVAHILKTKKAFDTGSDGGE